MTPEQYWHGNPWLYPAYRKAAEMRARDAEWERWEIGKYVYEAIAANHTLYNPFTKKRDAFPWLEEPYEVTARKTPEESSREAERKAHAEMAAWIMSHKMR